MDQDTPGIGTYAAALVVTLLCLALANVALAWLGGLASVRPDTPAAAVLAFVQGLAGALLAGFASTQLFQALRPVDFWLKWIVLLVAILFAVVLVWLLATGKSGSALTWTTYSGVAALIGTEVGRRIAKGLFRRSSPGSRPLPD